MTDETTATAVDAPAGEPPVPVWNGTAWVLPDSVVTPVVTTSEPLTGAVDDPLLQTIGDTAAAVGTVKGEIGQVESETTILGKANAAAEAAEGIPAMAETLIADLVDLEKFLVSQGSGVVALLKKAASAFHGISF